MFKALLPVSLHAMNVSLGIFNPRGLVSTSNVNTELTTTAGKHLYAFRYRIVDTEFDEEWAGYCDQDIFNTQVRAGALVSCYEYKCQNVALNLALYHRWMKDTYDWYGRAGDEIQFNTEHTLGYGEYAPRVREYLARFNNLKVFW